MPKCRIVKYVFAPFICLLIVLPTNTDTFSRNSATILMAVAAGYFLCHVKQCFQKKHQNVSTNANANAAAVRERNLGEVSTLQAATFANITIMKSHENRLVLDTTQSQLGDLQENYSNNKLTLTGHGSRNIQSTQSFWGWLFGWNVIISGHGSMVISGQSRAVSF